MTEPAANHDPELASRLAWIEKVRGLHRNKRMIGFAGVMAGAGMLLWWKMTPQAPDWAMWAGGTILGGELADIHLRDLRSLAVCEEQSVQVEPACITQNGRSLSGRFFCKSDCAARAPGGHETYRPAPTARWLRLLRL